MKEENTQQRILAVERFNNGEDPEAICASLHKSRAWLYKWVSRYNEQDASWSESRSCRPKRAFNGTPAETVEIVKLIRLDLYNHDLFCGAQAIQWEMEDMGLKPLPSIRTINRILNRHSLTHRRTGKYEAKGTAYPVLPSLRSNQTHQADLVGPCYLKGPVRFYSLNMIDTATVRCGLYPAPSKSSQPMIDGFWDIWKRLGMPSNVQLDNALSFFGSRKHPRGMGPLIRLCLNHGIEPWFIPMAEPWRNGMIEKFNDRYQKMFLQKKVLHTEEELHAGSLAFEQRHNSQYRFSKLKGKTPLQALTDSNVMLRFPNVSEAPKHPLTKPETGRYYFVRLIRSDLKLDVFGETFPVPPELKYEYVIATVNVKEQKLKLFLDKTQVEEFQYKLR
jgi:transposase InsO family protein